MHVSTPKLTPALTRFLHHLQRTHRDQIGSIPTPMLKKYAHTQRLHTLIDGHEPLGYIIANDTSFHPNRTIYPGQVRIYVCCIPDDLQRRTYGTLLVDHILSLPHPGPITHLGLWCASDIDARKFWTSIGFTKGRTRIGGLKRQRMHFEYTRPIIS